jgi:hypothetical protein
MKDDLEGSGHGPFNVLYRHLPRETEENHEKPQIKVASLWAEI